VSLLIRPALPEDAPELQALVRAVPGAGLPEVSAAYVAGHTVCAGYEGIRLAGFFALESRDEGWWLAHLWVAEPYARRGRGRWLLTDAVRRARRLGAESLRLQPEATAEPFFRSMGAHAAGGDPHRLEIDVTTWMEPLPESVSELGWIE
jgi:GNAT superfamily N-acetyltransferase